MSRIGFGHRAAAAAMLIAVGLIAYWPLLHYPASSGDSVALLVASRADSMSEFASLFTGRLLEHTRFPADFYRPVATASFALDQWLWGERWAGYFATNLLLQIGGAWFVFVIGVQWLDDRVAAFVAALVFLLHPLAMEVVPSISRRQDVLAGVMTLAAIAALLRWRASRRLVWLLVTAVASFCAVGSKEIGIVVPIAAGAIMLVRTDKEDTRAWVRNTIIALLVTGGAVLVYLVARELVLDEFGGYGNRFSPDRATHTVVKYLHRLFVPQGWHVADASDVALRGLAIALSTWLVLAIIDGVGRGVGNRRIALVLWIAGPLLVCLLTSTLATRSFYSAVAPTALLLGHLVAPLASTMPAVGLTTMSRPLGVVAAVLVASLIVLSPLFHRYDEWRANADALSTLLQVMRDEIPQSRWEGVEIVELTGVSSFREHFSRAIPRATTVPIFHRYVLSTYLDDIGYPVFVRRMTFAERSPALSRTRLVDAVRDGDTLLVEFGASAP